MDRVKASQTPVESRYRQASTEARNPPQRGSASARSACEPDLANTLRATLPAKASPAVSPQFIAAVSKEFEELNSSFAIQRFLREHSELSESNQAACKYVATAKAGAALAELEKSLERAVSAHANAKSSDRTFHRGLLEKLSEPFSSKERNANGIGTGPTASFRLSLDGVRKGWTACEAAFQCKIDRTSLLKHLEVEFKTRQLDKWLKTHRDIPWSELRQILADAKVFEDFSEQQVQAHCFKQRYADQLRELLDTEAQIGIRTLPARSSKTHLTTLENLLAQRKKQQEVVGEAARDFPTLFSTEDFQAFCTQVSTAATSRYSTFVEARKEQNLSEAKRRKEQETAVDAIKEIGANSLKSTAFALESALYVTASFVSLLEAHQRIALGENPLRGFHERVSARVESLYSTIRLISPYGSALGEPEELANLGLASLVARAHPLAHVSDAIFEPLFGGFETGLNETIRTCLKPELSYHEFLKEREIDPKLKWLYRGHQAAEIAATALLIAETGGAAGTGSRAMRIARSVGVAGGMSATNAVGQELLLSKEFDFERLADNTLSGTAHSMKFLAGTALLKTGLTAMSVSRPGVVLESLDIIDAQGDLADAAGNISKVVDVRTLLGASIIGTSAATDAVDVKLAGISDTTSETRKAALPIFGKKDLIDVRLPPAVPPIVNSNIIDAQPFRSDSAIPHYEGASALTLREMHKDEASQPASTAPLLPGANVALFNNEELPLAMSEGVTPGYFTLAGHPPVMPEAVPLSTDSRVQGIISLLGSERITIRELAELLEGVQPESLDNEEVRAATRRGICRAIARGDLHTAAAIYSDPILQPHGTNLFAGAHYDGLLRTMAGYLERSEGDALDRLERTEFYALVRDDLSNSVMRNSAAHGCLSTLANETVESAGRRANSQVLQLRKEDLQSPEIRERLIRAVAESIRDGDIARVHSILDHELFALTDSELQCPHIRKAVMFCLTRMLKAPVGETDLPFSMRALAADPRLAVSKEELNTREMRELIYDAIVARLSRSLVEARLFAADPIFGISEHELQSPVMRSKLMDATIQRLKDEEGAPGLLQMDKEFCLTEQERSSETFRSRVVEVIGELIRTSWPNSYQAVDGPYTLSAEEMRLPSIRRALLERAISLLSNDQLQHYNSLISHPKYGLSNEERQSPELREAVRRMFCVKLNDLCRSRGSLDELRSLNKEPHVLSKDDLQTPELRAAITSAVIAELISGYPPRAEEIASDPIFGLTPEEFKSPKMREAVLCCFRREKVLFDYAKRLVLKGDFAVSQAELRPAVLAKILQHLRGANVEDARIIVDDPDLGIPKHMRGGELFADAINSGAMIALQHGRFTDACELAIHTEEFGVSRERLDVSSLRGQIAACLKLALESGDRQKIGEILNSTLFPVDERIACNPVVFHGMQSLLNSNAEAAADVMFEMSAKGGPWAVLNRSEHESREEFVTRVLQYQAKAPPAHLSWTRTITSLFPDFDRPKLARYLYRADGGATLAYNAEAFAFGPYEGGGKRAIGPVRIDDYLTVEHTTGIQRVAADPNARLTEDEAKQIWVVLRHGRNWADETTRSGFEAGAQLFGYRTMLRYTSAADVSSHDSCQAMPMIVALYKVISEDGNGENQVSAEEFAKNILDNVMDDMARYPSGTAYHHLNTLAERGVTSPTRLLEIVESDPVLSQDSALRESCKQFLDPSAVCASWKSLKTYLDLSYAVTTDVQRTRQISRLRADGKLAHANFYERLAYRPESNVSMQALTSMFCDPQAFLGAGDLHANRELHQALKPSQYPSVRYLGLRPGELIDAYVTGSLDKIQSLPTFSVVYELPQRGKRAPNFTSVTPLKTLISEVLGSRSQGRPGLLSETGSQGLFGKLQSRLTDHSMPRKVAFVREFLRGDYQVSAETEQEMRSLIASALEAEGKIDHAPSTYLVQIHKKSSPLAVLAGNDTACCMPFGSGKNTVYMFNPNCSQLTVQRIRHDGTVGRTVAQSVLMLDGKTKLEVPEMQKQLTERSSVSDLLLAAEGENSVRYIACDSIETNQNYTQSPEQVEHLKLVYEDFFARYLRALPEQLGDGHKLSKEHVVLADGQFKGPFADNYPTVPNTYLPLAPVSYIDNVLATARLIPPSLTTENQVQLVLDIAPEKVVVQTANSGTVTDLTCRDSLTVGALEGKIYSDNNTLVEGLLNLENMLIAKDIANAHRGTPNLSLKYISRDGTVKGYLIAYQGVVKPIGTRTDSKLEPIVYIADFAAVQKNSLEAGKILIEFLARYKANYLDKGNPLPVIMEARERTSYALLMKQRASLERRLGIKLHIEDGGTYEQGGDTFHQLRITVDNQDSR